MVRHSESLSGLEIDAAPGTQAPASYQLVFDDGYRIALNELIGTGIQLRPLGSIVCRGCGTAGERSFANGYCYRCFLSLARCDLCVPNPSRCHYHLGTCREPEWGRAFCMQPHSVYLANTSGIKVGLTRAGRERKRWLDQGAVQGLVILSAPSRRLAGLAEAEIAGRLPDRTDWRKMLTNEVPLLDLEAARDVLLANALVLPEEVSWMPQASPVDLHYPLTVPPSRIVQLRLEQATVSGNLLGMKGQYLILSSGVFNVARHAGWNVEFRQVEPLPVSGGQQLGLFSNAPD